MERNVAVRLLVTGCRSSKRRDVSGLKRPTRLRNGNFGRGGGGRRGRGREAVKLGEARKGVRTEKERDERSVKVGFSIACYEPVV